MVTLLRKVSVAVANNNGKIYNYKDIWGYFQLTQDLCMDSLDRIELLLWLEEDFHIELDSKLSDKWFTVDDIIQSVIQAGGK